MFSLFVYACHVIVIIWCNVCVPRVRTCACQEQGLMCSLFLSIASSLSGATVCGGCACQARYKEYVCAKGTHGEKRLNSIRFFCPPRHRNTVRKRKSRSGTKTTVVPLKSLHVRTKKYHVEEPMCTIPQKVHANFLVYYSCSQPARKVTNIHNKLGMNVTLAVPMNQT